MKLVLCIFEQLSELKIISIRVIFFFGKAKEVENQYIQLFGCESGSLPFKYLGTEIHFGKLQNGE
jgi:hypothetical protein